MQGFNGSSIRVSATRQDFLLNTIITFSDGSEVTVQRGAQGFPGTPLTVTQNLINPNTGDAEVLLSDGTTFVVPRGPRGEAGQSITVSRTFYDSKNNTVVVFSDGKNATILRNP